MPTKHGAHGNNFICRKTALRGSPVLFVGLSFPFFFSFQQQGEPELRPVS